ncbi:MAG: NAD(P)-dependent oxidoreductase [Rhodospirillales bacterium]
MRIGIVGVGSMGGAMAGHLVVQGQAPLCFDSLPERRKAAAEAGLDVAESLADLAGRVDLALLSLPNSTAVEAVIAGPGGLCQALAPGAIVLDCSTSDPLSTKRMAALLAEREISLLDAPLSGGPAAAGNGTMTILLGGDAAAMERVDPLLRILGSTVVKLGPVGSGHAAKIANNMLCAANLLLVAEAVRMAEAAGIPASALLEGVNAGSGRSGVSQVNFPKWVLSGALDSGFTMGLMRKDVRLASRLAEGLGVETPAFARIAEIWAESAAHLPDDSDFNAIALERGEAGSR